MKLATIRHSGRQAVAIIESENNTAKLLAHPSMVELITEYPDGKILAEAIEASVDLDAVKFLAPIPRPARNIICVGKNYRAHAKEFSSSGFEAGAVAGSDIDEYPAVFTKPPSTVIATGEIVNLHPGVTSAVDYEAELGVIIGRGGLNISRTQALDHVFGYTIINDVTARDRQKNHKQWYLGKSLDTFCPMGPWITTVENLDASNLTIEAWVNGDLRQRANTADLIFDIPHLIETISAGQSLFPGDIIATGTPAGVGIGFNPPRFLKAGDEVRIHVSGIGEISNSFG